MEDAPKPQAKHRSPLPLVIVGLLIVLILAAIRFWPEALTPSGTTGPPGATNATEEEAAGQAAEGAQIPYNEADQDAAIQSLMAERKEQYQVGEGVDILAQSDESVTIGGNRVSMKDIQELIRQKTGEIAEEAIGPDATAPGRPLEMFGLYVVKPGDNIWNIHFQFLIDHFRQKQVQVAPLADEPNNKGYSSGIGKLLKFSENLVYIYNIKEKRLETDLDVIEPHSKILVYKIDMILKLLGNIDYNQIDEIRFDGDTLWIPPAS